MDKNKKSSFGMLSVKAGIDNNPNPTQADRIAGAKMKAKKAKKGGVTGAIKKIKGIGMAKGGFKNKTPIY